MANLYIKYGGHISFITGKLKESVELRGKTVDALLSELDEKYPGLKEIFIDPETGILNLRTNIYLRRSGEPTIGLLDREFELSDGDTLMLW